jgi:hypothetical protein
MRDAMIMFAKTGCGCGCDLLKAYMYGVEMDGSVDAMCFEYICVRMYSRYFLMMMGCSEACLRFLLHLIYI